MILAYYVSYFWHTTRYDVRYLIQAITIILACLAILRYMVSNEGYEYSELHNEKPFLFLLIMLVSATFLTMHYIREYRSWRFVAGLFIIGCYNVFLFLTVFKVEGVPFDMYALSSAILSTLFMLFTYHSRLTFNHKRYENYDTKWKKIKNTAYTIISICFGIFILMLELNAGFYDDASMRNFCPLRSEGCVQTYQMGSLVNDEAKGSARHQRFVLIDNSGSFEITDAPLDGKDDLVKNYRNISWSPNSGSDSASFSNDTTKVTNRLKNYLRCLDGNCSNVLKNKYGSLKSEKIKERKQKHSIKMLSIFLKIEQIRIGNTTRLSVLSFDKNVQEICTIDFLGDSTKVFQIGQDSINCGIGNYYKVKLGSSLIAAIENTMLTDSRKETNFTKVIRKVNELISDKSSLDNNSIQIYFYSDGVHDVKKDDKYNFDQQVSDLKSGVNKLSAKVKRICIETPFEVEAYPSDFHVYDQNKPIRRNTGNIQVFYFISQAFKGGDRYRHKYLGDYERFNSSRVISNITIPFYLTPGESRADCRMKAKNTELFYNYEYLFTVKPSLEYYGEQLRLYGPTDLKSCEKLQNNDNGWINLNSGRDGSTKLPSGKEGNYITIRFTGNEIEGWPKPEIIFRDVANMVDYEFPVVFLETPSKQANRFFALVIVTGLCTLLVLLYYGWKMKSHVLSHE